MVGGRSTTKPVSTSSTTLAAHNCRSSVIARAGAGGGQPAVGSGDEGRDDVGGVAIEAHAGAVVAHGGAAVGVAWRFFGVAQCNARVECGRDERACRDDLRSRA